MVIGEVVPKNLALEKADQAGAAGGYSAADFPPRLRALRFRDRTQPRVRSRTLLGLRGGQHGGGHSPEELKFIVESSRHEGHLERFEEEAINKLLELQANQRARNHDARGGRSFRFRSTRAWTSCCA